MGSHDYLMGKYKIFSERFFELKMYREKIYEEISKIISGKFGRRNCDKLQKKISNSWNL